MLLNLKELLLGPSLAHTVGRRALASFVALLALPLQASPAQQTPVPPGAVIASVEVSGFDIRRLSPGLQQEIRDLEGTPFNQERLDELAALAAWVAGDEGRSGPDVTRRVLSVAQWLLGKR